MQTEIRSIHDLLQDVMGAGLQHAAAGLSNWQLFQLAIIAEKATIRLQSNNSQPIDRPDYDSTGCSPIDRDHLSITEDRGGDMSTEIFLAHGNTERKKNNPGCTPEQPIEIADLLLAYLEQMEIEYVFGIPGGAIEPLFNAIARSSRRGGVRHILARHEAGAGAQPRHVPALPREWSGRIPIRRLRPRNT